MKKCYKTTLLSSEEMFLIFTQPSAEIKELEYNILQETAVDFEYALYQYDAPCNKQFRYGKYMPFKNTEIRKLLNHYFIFPKDSVLYYTYELPTLVSDWHGSDYITGLTHYFSCHKADGNIVHLHGYLFTVDTCNLISYFYGNFDEISLTFR
jgi:hypothetical protein